MQRVTRSTAVAVLPAPPAGAGSPGYFTGGNPGTGTPATVPGFEWFNGVQEEIIAVIVAAGLTPDAGDLTQLRQAIAALVAPDASTTVKGKIQLAISAEAQAFADGLKAITPASLNAAFKGANQSLAANGYQRLPGGLLIQWLSVSHGGLGNGSSVAFTFPMAFGTVYQAFLSSAQGATGGDGGTEGCDLLTLTNVGGSVVSHWQSRDPGVFRLFAVGE